MSESFNVDDRGASGLGKMWSVAMRDFRHTVMTKAFLFGVVGVPILIVAIGAIAALMMINHQEPALIGTVAVIDTDGEATEAARLEFSRVAERGHRLGDEELAEAQSMMEEISQGQSMNASALGQRGEVNVTIERIDPGDGPVEITEALTARVNPEDLLAVAAIDGDVLSRWTEEDGNPAPRFDLVVHEGVDSDHVGLIERTLGEAIVRVRATRNDLDADDTSAMLRRPRPETARRLASGETKRESAELRELKSQILPMVFMMLLFGSTLGTANQLLTSTIEEKSNKVMEVLLSAVSPMQLMTGKIIGQCLAGLIIVIVYSSLGIAGLIALKSLDLVTWGQLAFLVLFFFMAYFMFASLMAAVGSAVSDIREANSLVTPVMMLMMIPWILWMPISQAPNGTIATAFSFIPPVIPFVMVLRIAAEEPIPVWQIVASIAWGSVSTVGMVWMAARIFRIGVLMSGKPPSPLELLRWVRYS